MGNIGTWKIWGILKHAEICYTGMVVGFHSYFPATFFTENGGLLVSAIFFCTWVLTRKKYGCKMYYIMNTYHTVKEIEELIAQGVKIVEVAQHNKWVVVLLSNGTSVRFATW